MTRWIVAAVCSMVVLFPTGRIVDRTTEGLNPGGLGLDACTALPGAVVAERLGLDIPVDTELEEGHLTAGNLDTYEPFSFRASCDYTPSGRRCPLSPLLGTGFAGGFLVVNAMPTPENAASRHQYLTREIFAFHPEYSSRRRLLGAAETSEAAPLGWVTNHRSVDIRFVVGRFTVGIGLRACDRLADEAAIVDRVFEQFREFSQPLETVVAPGERLFR